MIGLHGTSLWSARRILRDGWGQREAQAIATPRMRTGPEFVYAVWADEMPEFDRALWVARNWAIEAAERVVPFAGRVLRGAVLVVETATRVMPFAELVAPVEDVTILGVLDVGRPQHHACPVCEAVGMTVCDVPWIWRWR